MSACLRQCVPVSILVALSLGCATRALPPAQEATALTAEALKRTQAAYLYPDRID